jgi:hypothetical protein
MARTPLGCVVGVSLIIGLLRRTGVDSRGPGHLLKAEGRQFNLPRDHPLTERLSSVLIRANGIASLLAAVAERRW